MYSELIYTRCGEGIDILRGRNAIQNSGFKVFSCSENVTETGFTDLPFLYAIAQSKEPYSDPGFMDDAYLYIVPDTGGKYLLNFHPIPFDKTGTGDYSHRPGNFINQIFIGEFEDIYPFELFGNDAVWDAKTRGEAFYYENTPLPLQQRGDLGETIGSVNFDDIAAFIADGRRDALINAIAFIISQYSLPIEERKYLVIKDENANKIELWIAALESAFSPRMASGLSFATRLDKFTNTNKYTVNLSGQYQTQINLQSPNQKLRLKAMIIGVDERDRSNTAMVRALANSPYVVLDGKTKSLSINMDTTNPFYKYVTRYDEGHEYFCREFLQMVDVGSPSGEVIELFSAYANLSAYSSSNQLQDLLPALSVLGKFKVNKTPVLEHLYEKIKQEIPGFLNKDAVNAFKVMRWLESTAAVVGDNSIRDSFKTSICHIYAEHIFRYPQSAYTKELHNLVMESIYAQGVTDFVTSQSTVDAFKNSIDAYKANDWVAFTSLFVDSLSRSKIGFSEVGRDILLQCIISMYHGNDRRNAFQVASLFSEPYMEQTVKALLTYASTSSDQNCISFLVQIVCRTAPKITSDEEELCRFYKELIDINLGRYFPIALACKAQLLDRTQDKERFIDWILSKREFQGIDLSIVFKTIDKNLTVSDKTTGRIAFKIQNNKSDNVVCVNSAHICALEYLYGRRQKGDQVSFLNKMISQGFPSIEDEEYLGQLTSALFSTKISEEDFEDIAFAAKHSAFYFNSFINEAMRHIGTQKAYTIGILMEIAAQTNSKETYDAFVTSCAEIKQFEKGMANIRETIIDKHTQRYFASVERDARLLHDKTKKTSLLGRLFSRGSSKENN